MSTENPGGGQPVGQLSPDGRWRWDGHNWVPAQQVPTASGHNPYPQGGQQPYGAQPQHQAHVQQQGQQYGGAMPPGAVQPKKGLPTWAKVLITLLLLFVGLIVLLTVVGLTMDEDYADWSCEDLSAEALRIAEDSDNPIKLEDIGELEVAEDNREGFEPPASGRGVVFSCEGPATWETIGESPVLVELAVGDDGEEWISYEPTD